MRIIALDHGAARIGVAICDVTETLSRPVGIVAAPGLGELEELVVREEAELVVVGLPVTLAGAEGDQAEAARAFAGDLAAILDVPVTTYDERLTTRLAESSSRDGAKAPPDALAAAHLLESFLQSRAANANRAPDQ